MHIPTRTALALATVLCAAPALAQVTFYENDNFRGRAFTTQRAVNNFGSAGFNDRASSIVVESQMWEVCDNSNFGGNCRVLRPGSYPSLSAMGMNDRISSVRVMTKAQPVAEERYGPQPPPRSEYQRRGTERLYEANVTNVRAVGGQGGQRCWMEREEVSQDNGRSNVPGALAGALIGGIIGHQIGGGTGRDIATVGGVVAGAAVGSRVGSDNRGPVTQDVQRCSNDRRGQGVAYWDVSYNFRGVNHRAQMTQAPGATVTVNRQGEPRG